MGGLARVSEGPAIWGTLAGSAAMNGSRLPHKPMPRHDACRDHARRRGAVVGLCPDVGSALACGLIVTHGVG
jgi:hypothetical protein